MSDKRYEANIIRATAVEPANNLQTTSAPGVWSIDEVVELQKKEKWPTVGNLPDSVENVFSTFLYKGTGSTQTITNNIDLSGEGGMVWTKSRSDPRNHSLHDSARGVTCLLKPNATNAEYCDATQMASFNSNGFTVGSDGSNNTNGDEYVSWTFRKKAKFLDIVTYTGTGSARTVAHNLGSVPGMIMVKITSGSDAWHVYHRGLNGGSSPEDYYLQRNSTDAQIDNATLWNDTAPTDSVFTVGTNSGVNGNGSTYVAYLFAHNNNDGEFGPSSDQDIIKCGFYNGTGSNQNIDLGFEAQWVLTKPLVNSNNWTIFDNMRGMPTTGIDGSERIKIEAAAETELGPAAGIAVHESGFIAKGGSDDYNQVGNTNIYVAIRRPQAAPTASSQVFAIDTQVNQDPPLFDSSFPVDFALTRNVASTADWAVASRVNLKRSLNTNNENAETSNSVFEFDFMDGWDSETLSTNSNVYSWMWKRARGYFDVVCYDGSGSNRTISHNLGVAPEMIWVKSRSNSSHGWMVYHSGTGATHYLMVNSSAAAVDLDVIWNDTAPTSSVFSVGTGGSVNDSGKTYIAYLFATLAGISKVGSYTGTGSTLNIDCGFSSGAKFVLIKRTNDTNNWTLFDTARGIVAGNDPYLYLNTTDAQVNAADYIDPYSAGFSLTGVSSLTNENGSTYIFYAIAT